MAKFLTTTATSAALEDLVRQARTRLTIISPYLQVGPLLRTRLADAAARNVEIIVVCREADLKLEERDNLVSIPTLRLKYLQNVHAKCFCNENGMVIGSLNVYQYSEANNREMGVLLTREDDRIAFQDALQEVDSIVNNAFSYLPSKPSPAKPARLASPPQPRADKPGGACIRCSTALRYQPQKPLCDKCYGKWAIWANEEFEEKFCHRCAGRHVTSVARPLCLPCFRAAPFAPAAR